MISVVVVFACIGTLAANEPDIDINRLRLVPEEPLHTNSFERRSVSESYQFRTNDYDDHSSGYLRAKAASLHLHMPPIVPKSTSAPLKVHQPREDPRLFYQSDAYLKENNGQNVNHEVSFVYPGNEVIRAIDDFPKPMPIRLRGRRRNFRADVSNFCVRCPHDRTLVAKAGSDRVLLQMPKLFSCTGRRAPRNVHFSHMYGPKFGFLIGEGSHVVVGRISHKNRSLQLCKIQVNVVTQSCVTPKYLTSFCNNGTKTCNFTCRDPNSELHGQSELICGSDMKWRGDLPVCRARTWCDPPSPPEHGTISCKGATPSAAHGLVEGSKCRVRCASGWRWHPRAVSVCRRGFWTNALTCQKANKIRKV